MIRCASCMESLGADAFGVLEPAEARLLHEHLASCPACAAERARLAPLPALLDLAGDATPAEPAPASLRPAVLDAYARDAGRRRARARRTRHWRRAAAAGAAIAVTAAAVLGVLAVTGTFASEPWSAEYALDGTAGAPAAWGTARVWEHDGGVAVRLQVEGLPPASGAAHYEMWFLGDGPPASAGAFGVGPDGTADVNLRLASPPGRFSRMGVSLEPDARDPARNGRRMLQGRLEG